MIWLDSVLAIPIIGIRLRNNYKAAIGFESRVMTFADTLYQSDGDLTVEQKGPWSYKINSKEYTFHINMNDLVIKFAYLMSDNRRAGGFPVIEKPEVRLYTEIMRDLIKHLGNLLSVFSKNESLCYNRVGIMAESNLDEDSLPPGVIRYIEHTGSPWQNSLVKVKSNVLSKLDSEEGYYDQCHHIVEFEKEKIEEKGYRIALDWQRNYKEARRATQKETITDVIECKEKAFEYFDKFGEGNLNYE